jgi:predicted MFS family arabinose efflux permease
LLKRNIETPLTGFPSMASTATTTDKSPSPLSQTTILVLAAACGLSVANVYFPQAISPLIGADLGVPANSAAHVVTAAQLGYALGLFFLVPLGDRLQHRPLVVTLLVLTAAGLLAASRAQTLSILVVVSVCIGFTTVVPQILLPMAAGLSPGRQGAVTGTLLSGLLGGILLARTFGGTLGDWLGWRAPYLVAVVLMLALAGALSAVVPTTKASTRASYPSLLFAAIRLFRTESELRRSCLYQASMFGVFTAAWTSLALLVTGPHYGFGTRMVGWIAFAGAASMFSTPIAGRWIDARGPDFVSNICFWGALAAAIVLAGGAIGGPVGLILLIAGMLLLDVAVQCGQAANQARIFSIRADARSRLNTAYMTCAFLGGGLGSWLGARIYTATGWLGVCGLVAAAALLNLVWHSMSHHPERKG